MRLLSIPVAALLLAAANHAQFTPGSEGVGDPLYPLAGNGGYDVLHYALALDYEPDANLLCGRARIRAVATQALSSFHLDLRGFVIVRLEVDGREAELEREGQELIVTPHRGIVSGREFEVLVEYGGTPEIVVDPDDSIEGWIPTTDGAVALGEPQGSPAWYPVNDTPSDKATYEFEVTVPEGLVVMANGVLVSSTTAGGRTTWVWREDDPMAPYLSTVALGRFDLDVYALPGGVPVYVAVDPHLGNSRVLARMPEILGYYASIFGPYPFDAAGAIVDDARFVFYALETQTKPFFDRVPDEATLAHELSHSWFGDSVTPTSWPDLWLNEGLATWSEWIWSEHTGGKTAAQYFHSLYAKSANATWLWEPPPGDPGSPEQLFACSVYLRGGMTVQALREKVGDETFFRILRDWAAENRHGNVTTADFVALAERDSGLDLADFFDAWIYRPGKPTSW